MGLEKRILIRNLRSRKKAELKGVDLRHRQERKKGFEQRIRNTEPIMAIPAAITLLFLGLTSQSRQVKHGCCPVVVRGMVQSHNLYKTMPS